MDEEKNPKEIVQILDLNLKDQEIFAIGKIIATWGALEYEIFCQVLTRFEHLSNLPAKARTNRFSDILEVWKEHVVEEADSKRKAVWTEQYELIQKLQPARNALVHGMLSWVPQHPDRISSIRVKKDMQIILHFDGDALHDFSLKVGSLYYKITYPAGTEDQIKDFNGFHASRGFWDAMMGN